MTDILEEWYRRWMLLQLPRQHISLYGLTLQLPQLRNRTCYTVCGDTDTLHLVVTTYCTCDYVR